MTSVIIPLQIAISIGGVLLFSANSEMLRDFFSFFKVVLWQGYLSLVFKSNLGRYRPRINLKPFLRPVDFRQEVENLGDAQLEEYGKLFNLTINLTMAFFFLNLFIVIIMEARSAATEEVAKRMDWVNYFEYLLSKHTAEIFGKARGQNFSCLGL